MNKGTEKELAGDFFNEIRKRNKAKFIAVMSKEIEKQQKADGGIDLPPFIEAENMYNQFKNAGCFDNYGYLKRIIA